MSTGKRCKDVESGGVRCELPRGHGGNHAVPRQFAEYYGLPEPHLVSVPTVADLAEEGLAKPVETTAKGVPTRWKIKKAGYAKIHEAEAHNAAVLRPLIDDVENKRTDYLAAQARLTEIAKERP